MRLKQMIAVALVAVCLGICLAGCSSSENPPSTSVSGGSTESSTVTPPSDSSDTPGEENPPETPAEINADLISEIGMTYSQLVQKYGEATGKAEIFNTYSFENGYGRYTWRSEEGKSFEDITTAGGCNMIAGIDMEELFSGLTFPIRLDKLADEFGFVVQLAGSEPGMDDCYWSELTHPLYDHVTFIFSTEEPGIIDATAVCTIRMTVDCLEAKPVV